MRARIVWAVLAVAVAPAVASGQGLSQRVAAVENGTLRFTYPTRPGVEICDRGIRWNDHRMHWRGDWDDEFRRCREGPAEVEVRMRSGRVRDVDLVFRERDRSEDAVELGEVSAQDAVDLFMSMARGGAFGPGEEDAIFPAVLADVEDLWRDLLTMAEDRRVNEDVRASALFWVSQEAAEAVTEGIARVARDEEEDQEIREAAVFALSRRPTDEGVPILMDVARTAEQAETRRAAMFWLARSEDERVYAFFEDILLRRGGGG